MPGAEPMFGSHPGYRRERHGMDGRPRAQERLRLLRVANCAGRDPASAQPNELTVPDTPRSSSNPLSRIDTSS